LEVLMVVVAAAVVDIDIGMDIIAAVDMIV
jgi:hypothetical protein